MPYLVPSSAFDPEVAETARMVAQFGDVDARLTRGPSVRVSYVVEAPGYGLPTEAVFEFSEWFHRTVEGWLRERYSYEYRPRDSRKAHHMGHGGLPRPHQHCEPPGRHSTSHYDDYERLLLPTAEELGGIRTRGEPIECRGLRRLAVRSPRDADNGARDR